MTNDDNLTFIASGIQVLMDNRFVNAEHWTTFDKERLLSLLRASRKSGVFLLSGDVHHA